jgi:hypothetical protein
MYAYYTQKKEVTKMNHKQLKVLSQFLEIPLEDTPNHENDYLVLTDEEADKACEEAIEESLWAFNPSFLASVTDFDISIFEAIQANEKCEDNNKAVRQLVGNRFSQLVKDAIKADGRGHFLSPYDGNEDEITYEGTDYYVYRIN